MAEPAALASYDAFVEHLGARLVSVHCDAASLRDDARLIDELGLDSLSALELLVTIEELGVVVDDDTFASCATLGELFQCARASVDAGAP